MSLSKKNQKTYNLLKAKWEFLRRNKSYIEKWKEALTLRKEYDYAPNGDKFKDCIVGNWLEFVVRDKIYQKENELSKTFGLNTEYLPNPYKNFDELIETADGIEDSTDIASVLNPAITILKKNPVKLKGPSPWKETPLWGRMTLEVDFTKVNSFKNLKSEVGKWLKTFYDQYLEESKKKGKGKKQKYDIDYNLLLQVGDLKEKQKMTNQQIAKKLFPRDFKEDFKEDSSSANPESAIRKISHYYKTYKELVNGGYEDINLI